MSGISDCLTVGTRTSELALWQTNYVMQTLEAAWPGLSCERTPFVTKGDKTQAQGKPLPTIGGKGLFTAELEESLRSGLIDLAVHSLKDLPVEDSPGLTLGAITNRADVRDALVARNGWTLATLPKGAVVGTSSTRRAAQLMAHRPDLTIRSIRGNVPTRARKVLEGEYDATLLAVAGLERLGLLAYVTEILALDVMLPAPGQGALAVQCRADDARTLRYLTALDDPGVRAAVTAERAFLSGLGGGCSAPVAAHALLMPSGQLELSALVGATDGSKIIRVVKTSQQTNNQPETLGQNTAQAVIAQGATQLLTQARTGIPPRESALPLQDKRVVVTRAEAQADSFADALTTLGATPILIPTIQIVPMPDLTLFDQALQALDQYNWLIFTSVNGVGIVTERLTTLQIAPDAFKTVKVAAVGETTADALRTHGIVPTFVPERYVAEAIVDGLGEVSGQRILLPQAEIARETLAQQLAERGATVDAIPVYQTLAADLDGDALTALNVGVDLLTFTSSSTVRNLVQALTAATGAAPAFTDEIIACIGPVTADTARDLGLHVDIVAAEHTIPGLIDAIVAYYQGNKQ
ncbi:MAG: hydroxymethylbilane synthase [Caldilineaceae bacterium]|nr:hydroxymethylbilane synthase [Caldilineaceae bacterium]